MPGTRRRTKKAGKQARQRAADAAPPMVESPQSDREQEQKLNNIRADVERLGALLRAIETGLLGIEHTTEAGGDLTAGDVTSMAYIAVKYLEGIEKDLEQV